MVYILLYYYFSPSILPQISVPCGGDASVSAHHPPVYEWDAWGRGESGWQQDLSSKQGWDEGKLWASLLLQGKLCLSSFRRVQTRFNTHYQNAYTNAFRNTFLELLHLSSNSIASTSREEGLVTAQLYCAVWPVSCWAHAVGDIKAFQNNFAFIMSSETCFWVKRVSDHTFFGVSD